MTSNNRLRFRVWASDHMIDPAGIAIFDGEPLWLIGGLEFSHIDAIPMQATGMADRNGKDIFEGDIIRFIIRYVSNYCRVAIGVVRFGPYEIEGIESLGWYAEDQGAEHTKWSLLELTPEVIGNIYENPDLL